MSDREQSEINRASRETSGVSRRQFGLSLGVAAGALAASTAVGMAATGKRPDVYDVVVIGGGFAGVTAAREARHAGHSVLIVEARDRLGGRTHSVEKDGHVVEYGGTWVHWSQPNIWSEVLRYNLDIIETRGATPDKVLMRSGGVVREASPQEAGMALYKVFNTLLGEASVVFPRPYDPFFAADEVAKREGMSIADRVAQVDLTGEERDILSGYFASLGHNHLDQVAYLEALRYYALEASSIQQLGDTVMRYRFKHGTGALIEAIRADGNPDIMLNAPVAHVVQSKSDATITLADGTSITARAVVVTLPLNVLNSVRFDPPLNAAKRQHSKERHAGIGVKGYATLKQNVGVLQALAPASEPISSVLTDACGDWGSRVIFFGADHTQLDVTDRDAVQAALRAFFPGVEVTELVSHDWNADPYALGTWCNFRPGQLKKYFPADRAQEGRLFFASGDTASAWRGSMDGAIERGVRCGVEVSELLAKG